MSESEEQGSLTRWASGKVSCLIREWSEAKRSPTVHVQRGDGSASFTNRHDATHFEQLRGTLKRHGWIVVKNETAVSSRIPQGDVADNHVSSHLPGVIDWSFGTYTRDRWSGKYSLWMRRTTSFRSFTRRPSTRWTTYGSPRMAGLRSSPSRQ